MHELTHESDVTSTCIDSFIGLWLRYQITLIAFLIFAYFQNATHFFIQVRLIFKSIKIHSEISFTKTTDSHWPKEKPFTIQISNLVIIMLHNSAHNLQALFLNIFFIKSKTLLISISVI